MAKAHVDPFAFWFEMACLWVGTFFYGIYLVTFCICMYILLQRPIFRPSAVAMLATTVILFLFATIETVINLVIGSAEILRLDVSFSQLLVADDVIYVTSNLLANGFLIYRCWVTWNYNHFIVIPGAAGLVISSVFGWDINLSLTPFFALTLATNLYIALVMAGRIWWIFRKLQSDGANSKLYAATSLAIVLESGFIYCFFLVVQLGIHREGLTRVATEMLRQIVGIFPTLIIIRIVRGLSSDALQDVPSKASISSPFHVRSASGVLDSGDEASFIQNEPPKTPQQPHYRRALVPVRMRPIPDLEKSPGVGVGNGSLTSMTFAPNDSLERPRAPPPAPMVVKVLASTPTSGRSRAQF